MIVKKTDVAPVCAICHRTLLLGERAIRYLPGEGDWVDVCPLCTEDALLSGWIREGSPTTPLVPDQRRRRRRLAPLGLLEGRRSTPEHVVSEPVLRRLAPEEQAMLEAAEALNASPYRRTVAGIVKSLGEPRVSFVPLSGTSPEMIVTVAWDISWYQYRVSLGTNQAVRLADRGYELAELEVRFQTWNGSLDDAGRLLPDIPRL